MIFENLGDFRTEAAGNPILGLDLGTKTIGVAVSDILWSIATPLATIKRKKFGLDASQLSLLLNEKSAKGLILGLPLNMDGTSGPRVQSTQAFAKNLSSHPDFSDVPIGFWDERLSTVAAERALLDADMSRQKRGQVSDHVAAGFILQGALDRFQQMAAGHE